MCSSNHVTYTGTSNTHVRGAAAVLTMHRILLAALLVHASIAHRHLHHHNHQITTTSPVISWSEKLMVVDADTGIKYNPYSKHHPGRHVCTEQKNVTLPVKTKQTVCKPTLKKYVQLCNNNQLCTGVRVAYETQLQEVIVTKSAKKTVYSCCPGWIQVNNRSTGCNRPKCTILCQNGGICSKPNFCSCEKGFSGKSCEFDVNECKENKPCDQICHNTPGSYRCECREDFILGSDGLSCRKEDDDEVASEAKDMLNELLDKRLAEIERILTDLPRNDEIKNIHLKITNLTKDIEDLKIKLQDVNNYKDNNVHILKNKLLSLEKKSNKLDELWTKFEKIKKCIPTNRKCI